MPVIRRGRSYSDVTSPLNQRKSSETVQASSCGKGKLATVFKELAEKIATNKGVLVFRSPAILDATGIRAQSCGGKSALSVQQSLSNIFSKVRFSMHFVASQKIIGFFILLSQNQNEKFWRTTAMWLILINLGLLRVR